MTASVAVRKQATRVARITSNFTNLKQVKQRMLEDLQESCLTEQDAKVLGVRAYLAEETVDLGLQVNRAGYQIPYFDLHGRGTKEFYRFRFLEYDNAKGFGKLVHSNGNGSKALKHDLRYTQPSNKPPQLYLPPTVDWAEVSQDVKVPIVFTEGEKKAACACKHGIATIGLGGVWNFKSAKEGVHLLPVFEKFKWDSRDVYICYDSDAQSNVHVCQAENVFAHELLNCGAVVYICRIPKLEGMSKTGIDDFIREQGDEAFKSSVLGQAKSFRDSEELYKLNGEVVYVKDPGVILRLENLQRISPRAFTEHAFSDRIWYETVSSGNGNVKQVPHSAAKEWLKWPYRATVERVTYRPGQPKFLLSGELNVWPGWGIPEPQKGDIGLWNMFMEYVFHDWEDAAFRRKWFEQWLAYPLQYPGVKLNQCVVMYSIEQGTGKSLIGYTLEKMYGRNFTEISDKNLQGNFNEWAENKQFVMGDEIASSGEKKRDTADRMKGMITQRELRLNPKYVPSYTVPDCINYYFTSNHADAFFVDDTDRRFFINEIKGKPMAQKWYKEYADWALEGPGASAIMYHLQHLDLSGFDPSGHAPQTASKQEMINMARSDVGSWAAALREDPDNILRIGQVVMPQHLWTTPELYRLYDPDEKGRVSLNGLARELRRAGFQRVRDGMPVRTKSAGLQRLWVIRKPPHAEQEYNALAAAKLYDDEQTAKLKGVK